MKEPIDKKINKVSFNRGPRYFMFFFIFLINLLVNMDHGTIPAATTEIMKSLDISEKILGIFGSLVYAGNIIGI
jgi:hypothetical protein